MAYQVAEQMADYLLTGAVTNALNMPSVTAEEAPRLKPVVGLAEKLGSPWPFVLLKGRALPQRIALFEVLVRG